MSVARAQLTPDVAWTGNTHGYFITPVAISPDGVWAASAGTNRSLRLALLADGTTVRSMTGHTGAVSAIAFSPDNSCVASSAEDRTLRIWEVATGSLLRTIPQGNGQSQFTAVAFHPDGLHVAGDHNRTNIALWNVADGSLRWEAPGNTAGIESIAFSPDGTLVASAGGYRDLDMTIRVRRAADGELFRTLITAGTYGVRQLAFSPDGRWLAAGCEQLPHFAGRVELWRMADWTRALELPVQASSLAFSPDAKRLLTLRGPAMELWQVSDGKLLARFALPAEGSYGSHSSVAISPSGDRILVGHFRRINTPNGTLTEALASALRFPMVTRFRSAGGNLVALEWSGGYGRFQVQRRFFAGGDWTDFGEPTSNRGLEFPTDGDGAMFRIVGIPSSK